jgi:hypothetical protein
MSGFLTKFQVAFVVPTDYKDETWPYYMVVRPEKGDIVVSVEGSELVVVSMKHKVQQTEEDGKKVHSPYLQITLQKPD